MTKKTLLLFLIFSVTTLVNNLYAQGKLQFEKETHDFGNIPQGVPVSYVFKFKNAGDQPVTLSNVQASCGCTTPEWDKDTPILPNKTGTIKAGYNAMAMGAFNKSITITSNAAEGSQVIFIKGTVVDKSTIKASYTPEEKAKSARLTIKKNIHNFGKLENGQKAVVKIPFTNTGKKDLTIATVKSACNCVNFKSAPQTIKAGKEGVLELTYTPRMLGDQAEAVSISSNDIITPEVVVNLKAKVVQSLSAQSVLKENSNAVPFK